MPSPNLLYSAAQVRALDAFAIAHGTSGYTLMKRAGEAALRAAADPLAHGHEARGGWRACGSNNGGDGYVLARFAQAAGLSVTVLAVSAPAQLRDDARSACEDFRASGGQILAAILRQLLASADVIVDALLGTGLNDAVRAPLAEIIRAINACERPVFALGYTFGAQRRQRVR